MGFGPRAKWFSVLLVLSSLTVMVSGNAQPTLSDTVGIRQVLTTYPRVIYPRTVTVGNSVEVKATVLLAVGAEGTASWLVVGLVSDNPESLVPSVASARPFTCDNPGPQGPGRADLCSILLSTHPFEIVVEFDLWAKNPGDVHMSITTEFYDQFKNPFPLATMTFGEYSLTVTLYATGSSEQFTVSVLPLSSSATKEATHTTTPSQKVYTTTDLTAGNNFETTANLTSNTTNLLLPQEIEVSLALIALTAVVLVVYYAKAKTRKPARKRRRTG